MDDYVESVKKGLKESRHYFGNAKKQERELWVLREFLSYLPIAINDAGITASAQEPHDVFYEQHGFQVKEVLSEGRLRGKEYADKVNAISEETKPDELFEPYTPIHIPLQEALPRVVSELARHREEKYKNQTSEIDVLVYLNLSDTTYTDEDVTYIQDEFSKWRSVSLVSNNCAIVLSCNNESNSLLSPLVGKLYVKN